MASTQFTDYSQNTPIVSAWLNDINQGVYTAQKQPKPALASAGAWVRFSIVGGVLTVQQSYNIANVSRTSAGVYVITYGIEFLQAANCYEVSLGSAGFVVPSNELANGVTLNCSGITGTVADPAFVSLVVHGAN